LDTTSEHAKARKTRHLLESFHGGPNPKAIETAWPFLKSKDYHLRYAARIAIEWQDPKTGQTKLTMKVMTLPQFMLFLVLPVVITQEVWNPASIVC